MAAIAAENTLFSKYVTSIDGWSLRFSNQTNPASTTTPAMIVASTLGAVKSASSPPSMMP